jgi:hypothetical protein
MRFGDILKEAFTITWRNRWFWLAGFLILPQLIGGYPLDFQYQPGDEFPLRYFLIIAAVGMGVAVFVILAGAILQPALTLATVRARAGSPLKAAEALQAGFVYSGRCLILALIQLGFGFLMFLMLGVPTIIAFINSIFLGIVVLVFFAPVALVVGCIFSVVVFYSVRNIVLLNLSVGDSLAKGYQQFKATKLPSIGLLLTSSLIPVMGILPLSFPVSMVKVFMKFGGVDSLPFTVAFYSIVTLLSIPIVGYFGAFSSVLWTIAHQEWFGDGTREPTARF